ncbi:MAG TPA: low affinity iron permease family protein [Chryseosolibacter sp.]
MKIGKTKISRLSAWFNAFSTSVTHLTGRPAAFILACVVILVWACTGPLFDFSDTWQLVINTSTTIITFLMVFVIQQSQNKDTRAVQLKLNELIACNDRASNRLIVVEDLTEEELEVLKTFYVKLYDLARNEKDLHKSHSIDEANEYHRQKHRRPRPSPGPGPRGHEGLGV